MKNRDNSTSCPVMPGMSQVDKRRDKVEGCCQCLQTKTPSKHLMTLLHFFVIWLLVHLLIPLTSEFMENSPILGEMVTVALIVLIMTYIVSPAISRWILS